MDRSCSEPAAIVRKGQGTVHCANWDENAVRGGLGGVLRTGCFRGIQGYQQTTARSNCTLTAPPTLEGVSLGVKGCNGVWLGLFLSSLALNHQ
jgi:hypothetical protein